MAQARAALRDVVPNLVTLVRSVPDAKSASVGTWTVGDVAAHLSHRFRADTHAIAGRPVPQATVTKAGIAEATAKLQAEDSERDPAVLADRIATPVADTAPPRPARARGRAFPPIAALPPTAFMNQEIAGTLQARIELRLRGGRRTLMVLDHGSLTLDTAATRDIDARIWRVAGVTWARVVGVSSGGCGRSIFRGAPRARGCCSKRPATEA